MSTDIYICSKPLQYFNIRNIKYQSSSGRKVLLVLGSFIDAEKFVEKIRMLDTSWDEIKLFKSHGEIYLYLFFHPAINLFVEIDASFVYGIFYKLARFKNMYMFEEGFGSYRRDRFDRSKGIKKMINAYTGVGHHVGFSRFLSGQYLYLPELYRMQFPGYPKMLYSFNKPFIAHLQEELSFFLELSENYESFLSIKNRRIGLYLTNHSVNDKIITTMYEERDSFDLMLIKLHPHIKKYEGNSQYNLNIIHSNIMIEFLLILLLRNENEITVFHENSTAVIWFQNRISCRNMGEYLEEYDIVESYIRSNKL